METDPRNLEPETCNLLSESLAWLDYCLGETLTAMEAVREAALAAMGRPSRYPPGVSGLPACPPLHHGGPMSPDGLGKGPESIIGFTIARAVREQPDQAEALMLTLIRQNAHLEVELDLLTREVAMLIQENDRLKARVDP